MRLGGASQDLSAARKPLETQVGVFFKGEESAASSFFELVAFLVWGQNGLEFRLLGGLSRTTWGRLKAVLRTIAEFQWLMMESGLKAAGGGSLCAFRFP